MNKGKVILAGAGPGDPELISVKAARYLQSADVIITDRLVSQELMQAYANPLAEIVFVGKEGNASGSTPQNKINDLLIRHFAPGKLVVRLKGGDVAFFSNVLDELITLEDYSIPYEIIPGITAASGASAYAGIPLTARGYSRSVRFITYYKDEKWKPDYWNELAHTGDTLVLYMSACKLSHFARCLIRHGASPDKPLAVIEQATTPYQKVYTQTLQSASLIERLYVSPSLVIIGDVVELHEQYRWRETTAVGRYFEPAENHPYKKSTPEYAG
jgi:uroporphyrin-III C-methyltransferase